MPLLLLIFFGIYGWIEFEAFIVIGNAVGGLVTFLGIFITAFITALMKRQGASVVRNWQASLSKGELTHHRFQRLFLNTWAVLMLLPGYVTDFTGLLCFAPGIRFLIGQAILSRLSLSVITSGLASGFSTRFGAAGEFSPYNQTDSAAERFSSYARHHPLHGNTIEGQFESKDDPKISVYFLKRSKNLLGLIEKWKEHSVCNDHQIETGGVDL